MNVADSERRERHVVVIGGGIVGAAVLVNLAWRGIKVTLVEAEEPGSGATRISFAWLMRATRTRTTITT